MAQGILQKYICLAFTYSGIRKLIYTYDTKYQKRIKNEVEERPVLYTHRVIHFLFAGIMGIGLAPIHIMNDVERLEMHMRNIEPFPKCYRYDTEKDFYSVLWDEHKLN